MNKKVLVAMSGGVDSSVAAALLKTQGYFVAGGYMKNFSPESWNGVISSDCPWEKDVEDAKAVCGKLGIEFRSFNFEKEYREKVIDYFFNEYQAGRTPNPDVMCNKEIKFKLFLEKALELGFDYIATGHYARVINSSLFKGVDPKKDQSYFLYTLTQDQLKHSLFPIGEYTKTQVRNLAREFGLPNADKKDSQGVCFVGKINLREFLKQRIPEKTGEIVDETGKILGMHRGAWYFTIGQRQGIGLGGGKPYYVVQKDVINNRLTVTTSEYAGLVHHTQAVVSGIHWISGEEPRLPLKCKAKIRYQQPDQECTLSLRGGAEARLGARLGARQARQAISVEFAKPQFAIAPGQAIVFYHGDKVLGGGIIETKLQALDKVSRKRDTRRGVDKTTKLRITLYHEEETR